MREDDIRKAVREGYSRIAEQSNSCCEPEVQASSCCGPETSCGCGSSVDTFSKVMGYTNSELGAIPEGANLGLGCGNPTALASLKEGEVVLDLGSGAGIDCFLASKAVGLSGKVIGVDMTPSMLERARENAQKGDFGNVEFRLGEIEHMPVADNSVDVIISNCVINLSPVKKQVFSEAYRVLKPGGRLMVSDIVLLKELPDNIKNSIDAYVGCVAGADTKENYLATIESAGFTDIKIAGEQSTRGMWSSVDNTDASQIVDTISSSISSLKVSAMKP
ncbi:arsenite methyltransferase [Chloroflexota bacterium]